MNNDNKTNEKRTLSLKEVANLLCLKERRLRDLAEAGVVPGGIKPPKLRKWLFSKKAIEEYLGVSSLDDL